MNTLILGIGQEHGLHQEGLPIYIQIAAVHIQVGRIGVGRLPAFRQGEEHKSQLVVLPVFLTGAGCRQI